MQKQIRNLLNKEEWIVLNLKNASHQAKLYLEEIPKFAQKYKLEDSAELMDKANWFKQLFEYYRVDLIPAIQETAEMEKRHLDVFDKNPDPAFHPELEVENHQHLTKQFLQRFEGLHKEFESFVSSIKNANK